MANSIEDLKNFIIKCLEEKKAQDIVIIDIEQKTNIAKYMIFATGRSVKNIGAIAEYIRYELKHKTNYHFTIEGINNTEWVLIDIGDIIVHIFYKDARESLKLEQEWQG